MTERIWRHELGDGPLVAAAIHDGHLVRDELVPWLALDKPQRLREEDPHTGQWTRMAPTRIVGLRSRFEVDLNRPRHRAVYRTPEDAWGLNVWRGVLDDEFVARSLAGYDVFYSAMYELLSGIEQRHGAFVVFDLHSYNHRRNGADGPLADPALNPQINVGTGNMDRARWGSVVERFMSDLSGQESPGGRLDVRENVCFTGGHFSRWVHDTFPNSGCVLAIEIKKFFMDEWTGTSDLPVIEAIGEALGATVAGVLEELGRLTIKIAA